MRGRAAATRGGAPLGAVPYPSRVAPDTSPASARGRFGRLLRACGAVLLFAALVALVGEGGLRAASLFARDRAGDWRPGAAVRILSVGDSHTFGTSVARDESYPAQLQRLLDDRSPGHFSLINLGIPGVSSTQVRKRLPAQVARYQPDIVIVWCGVNDYWNSTDLDDGAGWAMRLDAVALGSRLYRFVRVLLHDFAIERSVASVRADGTHQEAELAHWQKDGDRRGATWKLRHGGRVETVRAYHDPAQEDAGLWARSYHEYKGIAAWLDAAGVSLVFIRYPLSGMWPFEEPNRAMRRAAAEDGVPIIDSRASIARIPREQWEWLPGSHPSAPMYREIARDLVPVVLELSSEE